jgi:DUF1009 family protein
MGRRIGIIAGSGRFAAAAVSELRRAGFRPAVLAIEGETRPGVKRAADVFAVVKPGELGKALAFFKENEVAEIMLLGKVRPDVVFRPDLMDAKARKLLRGVKERSARALLEAAFGFLEASGLKVLNTASLLEPNFCRPGVLTRKIPSSNLLRDIDFGLRMARRTADLEIGQTLVVKDGSVVAVEGIEGTDMTIRRGGRLAGPGFVVVKAARTNQDLRIDVPAVGLDTVKALVRAGGAALGLEAAKVAFFQREAAVALADAHGAAVVIRALG